MRMNPDAVATIYHDCKAHYPFGAQLTDALGAHAEVHLVTAGVSRVPSSDTLAKMTDERYAGRNGNVYDERNVLLLTYRKYTDKLQMLYHNDDEPQHYEARGIEHWVASPRSQNGVAVLYNLAREVEETSRERNVKYRGTVPVIVQYAESAAAAPLSCVEIDEEFEARRRAALASPAMRERVRLSRERRVEPSAGDYCAERGYFPRTSSYPRGFYRYASSDAAPRSASPPRRPDYPPEDPPPNPYAMGSSSWP